MSLPVVSVLLASRNGSRFLPEALESLARQTYSAMELLLVDDGSTDATGAILHAFARSHPKARVLQSEGIGLAGALRLAALASTGAFLARHDDDDRSHPERLARQMDHLRSHPEDGILGTGAVFLDADGVERGPYPVPIGPKAVQRVLRRATPFVHGSVVMRRDAYERAGGYRAAFRASQDYDLWLRIPEGIGLANLPEPLYAWRFHPGGVFARARSEQLFYAALARTFAEERRATGSDSIALFESQDRDPESFLARYARSDRLAALWGETLVREGLAGPARRLLRRAVSSRRSFAPAALWWALSWAVALTPRGRRHRRVTAPASVAS